MNNETVVLELKISVLEDMTFRVSTKGYTKPSKLIHEFSNEFIDLLLEDYISDTKTKLKGE